MRGGGNIISKGHHSVGKHLLAKYVNFLSLVGYWEMSARSLFHSDLGKGHVLLLLCWQYVCRLTELEIEKKLAERPKRDIHERR